MQKTSSDQMIRLQDVSFCFPKALTGNLLSDLYHVTTGKIVYGHLVLRNVNLEISTGDRVGLIGLNGSGKTTLLRILAGIYRPTKGKVSLSGDSFPLISFGAGADANLSGEENIHRIGWFRGISDRVIKEKKDSIVKFIDIGDAIKMPLRTYSTGMKVRVGMSITNVISPKLLLMDEGFGAGDKNFMLKASNLIESLVRSSSGLVLSSHNLGIIRQFTEKCIVLDKGEIVFFGNSESAISFYKKNF